MGRKVVTQYCDVIDGRPFMQLLIRLPCLKQHEEIFRTIGDSPLHSLAALLDYHRIGLYRFGWLEYEYTVPVVQLQFVIGI
jgi:hypothetical protein